MAKSLDHVRTAILDVNYSGYRRRKVNLRPNLVEKHGSRGPHHAEGGLESAPVGLVYGVSSLERNTSLSGDVIVKLSKVAETSHK